MELGFHLGIDTSNYTTSAAAVTTAGEVFCAKRPLPVPAGDRGLRQSDALFCHTKELSSVIDTCLSSLREKYPEARLLSVGVSKTPRRQEGSYMPCFLAGVMAAESIAAAAGVPLFSFSHQEGHIRAALLGAAEWGRALDKNEFFAFHLSGGTTELLRVKKDGIRYEATLVAEGLDLTLGQLVDRCGVALSLPFPAGAHLEKLALSAPKNKKLPKIPKKEGGVNLSGFENRFQKGQTAGKAKEVLAREVFDVCISAVEALMEVGGVGEEAVLFSGGVSSSEILKEYFSAPRFYFSPPSHSADNAMGIALLAKEALEYGC